MGGGGTSRSRSVTIGDAAQDLAVLAIDSGPEAGRRVRDEFAFVRDVIQRLAQQLAQRVAGRGRDTPVEHAMFALHVLDVVGGEIEQCRAESRELMSSTALGGEAGRRYLQYLAHLQTLGDADRGCVQEERQSGGERMVN